jgi:hypothetical protein
MEALVAPCSPVALRGSRAGQTPTNSGRTLPPEIRTPDEPRALLRVPSLRVPTGMRTWALLAIFSLPTTSGSLRHIAPCSWNSP